MTAEEKAKSLVERFSMYAHDGITDCYTNGIEIASIHVGEIITLLDDFSDRECLIKLEYYKEVRHEINKL